MRSAIFSCKGLGDGLISIALAHNLYINDYEVDIFHGSLHEMKNYFQNFSFKSFPSIKDIQGILQSYDRIFIFYDSSDNFIQGLIKQGKKNFAGKVLVLNSCPSRKVGGQPYYKDALFHPSRSMVDNIDIFCKNVLKLKKTARNINFILPENIEHKKYKKRIIIHPSSAKESKNWPKGKYIKLAKKLKNKEYEPVFVVSKKEEKEYQVVKEKNLKLEAFESLKELISFVYESAYVIGNDSGIGHLASLLGLGTLIIFRNYRSANLWRPGWKMGKIVYPNRHIPNFSFFRLRDKYWKNFISVKRVLKLFLNNF